MSKRLEYMQKNLRLGRIINALPEKIYSFDSPWESFQRYIQGLANDYGGIDMNPDFQRGHVWTPEQQRKFVESALRGALTSRELTIQFNCANWDLTGAEIPDLPIGLQCVDGLQRITTIQAWLDGRVEPFGLSLGDLENSSFSPNRASFRWHVAIHNFQTKAELLDYYLAINMAGTPHSDAEIERVKQLRDAACAGQEDRTESGERPK
jgi:uncharacterized protein with ParB-like and HNH nuclease domain